MKANNFQIVLIVIFLAAAVAGMLTFAGVIKIGSDQTATGPTGTVTLWGTERASLVAPLIDKFNNQNENIKIRYSSHPKDVFDKDLLEAIATGSGPDLFFITNDLAYSYSNKIHKVPYLNYPEVSFKASFAPAGEVFLASDGILAFPITIDPMAMYYDRSIFNSNGIIFPPQYWEDLTSMVPILTQKDESGQISKSTIALGQFSNVKNAKDIIVSMFMQMGNNIVGETQGIYYPVLGGTRGINTKNLESALAFYTSFADPLTTSYSWNRSLPDSDVSFSAGNLAIYFGFASELGEFIKRNPNQDFAVAPMPQIKNSTIKSVNSKVTGVAISAFSKKQDLAYIVATSLSGGEFASDYAQAVGTTPARRDLLYEKKGGVYDPVFYSVALYAKSWLDPDAAGTNTVFRQMIEGILSNTVDANQALMQANSRMSLLLVR